MAKTMAWPPVVVAGRTKELFGRDAIVQLITQTLDDHASLVHMDSKLYLGDQAWRDPSAQASAMAGVLSRLKSTARNLSVTVLGPGTFEVSFTDDDGLTAKVSING